MRRVVLLAAIAASVATSPVEPKVDCAALPNGRSPADAVVVGAVWTRDGVRLGAGVPTSVENMTMVPRVSVDGAGLVGLESARNGWSLRLAPESDRATVHLAWTCHANPVPVDVALDLTGARDVGARVPTVPAGPDRLADTACETLPEDELRGRLHAEGRTWAKGEDTRVDVYASGLQGMRILPELVVDGVPADARTETNDDHLVATFASPRPPRVVEGRVDCAGVAVPWRFEAYGQPEDGRVTFRRAP